MSRTGIFSLRSRSAVPPVEIISTPCFSSARANLATPALSETEMSARVIFIKKITADYADNTDRTMDGRRFFVSKSIRLDPRYQRFRISAINDHVLRRRIQHRTATDRFAKRFAEMAEAGITDF